MKILLSFILIMYQLVFFMSSFALAEIVGDINYDKRIDLSEAIYALQVSANVSKIITVPNTIIGDASKRLSGLIGITMNTNEVVGVNTLFTQELKVGDSILIGEELFTVKEVNDDTHLLINEPHSSGALNVPIYTDNNLLSIKNGKGVNKVIVDKTGNLILDPNGNVGIGSSDPNSKLEIVGSGNKKSLLRFSTDRGWEFRQHGTGGNASLELHSLFESKVFIITGVDMITYFRVHAKAEDRKIELVPEGGNAIVGGVNHNSNLKVYGSIKSTHFAPQIFLEETDNEMLWSIVCDGKNFQIRDHRYTDYDEYVKFSINSDGNIGIGTPYPKGKLDVNGTIYQRGIVHSSKALRSEYKIESIKEHTKEMFTTGKLKAMPKKQKDKNGNDVIEVGSQLKGIVEELEKAHIYINQLNTTLQDQQKTIKELSEKISVLQLQLTNNCM